VTEPVEPTTLQLRVLRMIPHADGLTTPQVVKAAKRAGIPTGTNDKGPTISGVPADRLLRTMRRNGWLIRNRHVDPPRHVRTPTGTDLATRRRPARLTTTPRQEATAR
jgi:hypothetical protein